METSAQYRYEEIPERFRDSSNRWNELAWHVLENGTYDVALYPKKEITNPEILIEEILSILGNSSRPDFYNCAIAAWALWSAFDQFEFYYE